MIQNCDAWICEYKVDGICTCTETGYLKCQQIKASVSGKEKL